jgi:hypothetical protein
MDQFHWLDFPKCRLDQKFACIAFRWVAISLGKRVLLKILRKISFQVLGGQSRLLGRTVRGFLIFIKYLRFLAKVFEKSTLPGGQSAGPMRTVRYSPQHQTEQCGTRWTGRARPTRTDRGVLADSPPGPTTTPDSRWLRVFTIGIQTRTVREGITDSPRGTHFFPKRLVTGRGSINTSSPGLERLSWHFERSILPCRALPLLSFSLTWLSGCIFFEIESF